MPPGTACARGSSAGLRIVRVRGGLGLAADQDDPTGACEPALVGYGGGHAVDRERRRGCRGRRGQRHHHLGRSDTGPVRSFAHGSHPAVASTSPELFPARRYPHPRHPTGRASAATRLLRPTALAHDLPDRLSRPCPKGGIMANLPSKGEGLGVRAIKERGIKCAACGERDPVLRGERGPRTASCAVCREVQHAVDVVEVRDRVGILVAVVADHLAHDRPLLLLPVRLIVLVVGAAAREREALRVTLAHEERIDERRPLIRVDAPRREGETCSSHAQGRADGDLALVGPRRALRPAGRTVHFCCEATTLVHILYL